MTVFYIVDWHRLYSVMVMKILKDSHRQLVLRSLEHLYWSNHLVAMISALSLIPAYVFLGEGLSWTILCFVYLSSYLVYCLDRSFNLSPEDEQNNPERSSWLNKYRLRSALTLIVYFCLSSYLFLGLNFKSQFLLVVLAMPTLAYVLPIIPYKGWKRTKEFTLGKSFNISFVWAALGAFLPACDKGVFSGGLFVLFILSFLVTLISCQFFDLRDYLGDKSSGIRSLTVMYGRAFCFGLMQKLCVVVLFLSLLLLFWNAFFVVAYAPVVIYYLWKLKSMEMKNFDYLFIDLALVLPALGTLLFYGF